MEETKDYRKDLLWTLLITIVAMIIQLFVISIFVDGKFPAPWLGILIGSTIRFFVILKDKEKTRFDKEIFIVPIVMIGNYFIFKNDIYIPNYIVLFASIGLICVYYSIKIESKYKLINIGLVCILFIGFFSVDYYMYSNRLIKDINFQRAVKKEYNISGKVDKDSLRDIDKLGIGRNYSTNNLEGIQHFENLNTLHIWEGEIIKDFTPINLLQNLERLLLGYVNLDQVQQLKGIETLEWLEIIYPNKGKLSNLNNLPNLKKLELQGMNLDNLNGLRGPEKLERLSIAYSVVISLDGIENLPYLKEISLSNLNIIDISPLFNLKNIENISIRNCEINNKDEFVKVAKQKGIKIEISNSNNDFKRGL